jgi:hypothetical protein
VVCQLLIAPEARSGVAIRNLCDASVIQCGENDPPRGAVLLIILNSHAAFRKSVASRFANTQALSTILRARILKDDEGNWS